MATPDPDTGFLQDPPHLGNTLRDDAFLLSLLHRLLPPNVLREALPDLERFGWEVATFVKELGQRAELVTSGAWKELKSVAAREGLVGAAYERRHSMHSRPLQVAKLYLFGASSGLYNCPLAMTDGAARLCELLLGRQAEQGREGELEGSPELRAALGEAFSHLTSIEPGQFWTSGQWMTEKAGGSDVSRATETVAVPESAAQHGVGSWFRLSGYKWFTSAADGEMAMVLAREQPGTDADSATKPDGSGAGSFRENRGGSGTAGGLTLFYVPVLRDEAGRPQGFEVVRLKDKLGTRQLPTAELRLAGMRGLKISASGRGVASISAMVNITRLHNAAAAASYMRRITALAQDYARRRSAFGAPLIRQPLAQRTLAWLHLHTAGSLALTLEVARLLGLHECGAATAAEAHLLRLLTPLAKLFTAKEAVSVVSEGIEFFGGQGYIEPTHLPVILRDTQVLPIWEGTTSLLSLDVLRVLCATPQAAAAFMRFCASQLQAARKAAAGGLCTPGGDGDSAGQPAGNECWSREGYSKTASTSPLPGELLQSTCAALLRRLPALGSQLRAAVAAGPGSAEAQMQARDLSFSMSRMLVAVLLVTQAAWSGDEEHVLLAVEWAREAVPGVASSGVGESEGKVAATAQLRMAWVLSGAGQALSQPRARY